jgi:DNA repair ATPase RecN
MVNLHEIAVKLERQTGTHIETTQTSKDADMNEASDKSVFTRIGDWFRRGGTNGHEELPLQPESQQQIVTRASFFRPWARRDQAIQNLQSGFGTLTDLMAAIKANLERQDQRNEELLHALQQLPQILESVPETNKLQTETLRAIHQQMEHQNGQQTKLAEILDRICDADAQQSSTLEALRDRVETLTEHDQSIASNLNSVGSAMASLSQNTQASTEVLSQMRSNIDDRDRQLESILHRQGTRFTTMLAVAIFLSIAALAAVATMAYLGYEMLNKTR